MIRSLTRPPLVVGAIVLVLGVLATLGLTVLSGTKTGVALALAAVLGPLAAYGAICAPLVFPFTAYIVLVPFDNLLALPSFGTVTRLVAIACGASIVLWLIRTRRSVAPDRALVFWFVLGVWAAASLTWAIDPNASYAHLFTFVQLLGLYAAAAFVPIKRRELGVVLIAVVLSGAFAASYGVYVFRHGIDVNAANGRLWLQNDNNIVDPNQFAASLLLPCALALAAFLRTKSWTLWLGATMALLVMGLGIAISGSRGAVLALAAALLYIVFRMRTRLLAAGIAFGVLSCALAFSSNLVQRFSTAGSSGGAGRLDIWRVGLNAFRDHFWFGAGYSNFPLAYDQAFLSVSEHHYTWWHRAPHNILLSMGVELGIIGLLLFVIAYVKQFRTLRGIGRQDSLYDVRVAIEGALIGLFVAGFFVDILYTKYFWLALMLAMLVRNAAYAPQRASSPYAKAVPSLLPSVDHR